jgi:hypothetical protein
MKKPGTGDPFRAECFNRLSAVCSLFADLVADQAADRSAADGTDRAAARKDRAADRADAGANRRILVARRHPAATCRSKNYRDRNRADCQFPNRFHWITFFSDYVDLQVLTIPAQAFD